MPDSVLAQVGKTRVVTVSEFRRAWTQMESPSRPDSLTPEAARRFLDLLIDKETLGERALQERWTWTAMESAQYVSLRDRLTLKVVLDSVLLETRAARIAVGDSALDVTSLGIAAREATIASMAVRFDDALVGRLVDVWKAIPRPAKDSTIWSNLRVLGTMPAVDPADTGAVVAESGDGPLRVSALLESWKKLNPLYRPRIESAAQMHDVIDNALYERRLRQAGVQRGVERRPDVAAELANQRELNDVTHLVQRDVYEKIATDSLTLLSHYRSQPEVWKLPRRLMVARFLMPERHAASQMALRLREPGQAESLIAQGRRKKIEYSEEISAETDSLVFAVGLRGGIGAVVGPDSVAKGWQVARVMEIREPRQRGFDEVRTLVHHDWYGRSGEERMRSLLDRLRKQVRVVVNENALKRLAGG